MWSSVSENARPARYVGCVHQGQQVASSRGFVPAVFHAMKTEYEIRQVTTRVKWWAASKEKLTIVLFSLIIVAVGRKPIQISALFVARKLSQGSSIQGAGTPRWDGCLIAKFRACIAVVAWLS